MFKKVSLLFIINTLLGCATTSDPTHQPYVDASTESAIVYIYRLSRTVNCCFSPNAYINDKARGSLKNGGYLVFELPKGNYSITVGDGSYGFEAASISKQLHAGEVTYLKWVIGSIKEPNIPAMLALRNYHLQEVNLSEAKNEISNLKLSER